MSSKKKSASSARVGDAHEKSTDKLSVKEFRDRFCIPNGVIVELLNGEDVVSTKKAKQDIVIFSKEQFNAGLRFPLPTLFMEFLHFTKIPPVFIHPNIIRVLMGCNIINMLFNLDLTLLEVFFVYSLKKAKTDIFSLFAHLPSLQLVTELPDSTKGGVKGQVMVRGAWGGVEASGEAILSKLLLSNSGSGKKGPPHGLGGKGVFCLSQQEDAKEVVPGEHYTVKDLPIYQALKEANAEKRRALLDNREKKKNEGTLRKAPGQKCGADSPPNKTPAKKRKLVKNGKGVKELTPPREFAPPPIIHEAEGPPSKRPRSARNLRSGLLGRLQDRQQEIEVSCSSAHGAHPEGGEVEMTTEPPAVPEMVPAEVALGETHPVVNADAPNPEQESPSVASSGGDPVNDASCTSASPFSYVELEDKLKQIPPGLTSVMPSAKMFEMWNRYTVFMLVSGLRGMANQYDLFTDLLRTIDYMKAFAARHKDTEDQLRLRLGESEASVSTAREENEALQEDLADAKSREESMDAHLQEAEG
ncbi:hypothetical protein CK203_079885 [Vitis vinifera]|uniref:Uncharacterized protein n=1 Tax=Vitis vinifera TaxID=29760 RepID=A0A438DHX3_VITVI|nr:hypothetical protein CK203_079885 [Vitis vinifera]